MNKVKEYKWIIIITFLILGFSFYWFQYRPSEIKSRCLSEAEFNMNISTIENAQARYKATDDYYQLCLHRFGL